MNIMFSEEEIEKVRRLFSFYDRDKNGFLDSQELKDFMENCFNEVGESTDILKDPSFIGSIFQNFCSKEKELIDRKEFLNLVYFLVVEKGYELV